MRLNCLYIILLITFANQKLLSQSTLPSFGNYTPEELNMKECSFDKDADAVVLLDEAFSNYDDEWQLRTTRRIRIKILNERGIDQGNIVIPFYSRDKFEYITDIQGITYTENSDPGISNLNRKSIYTEKVDDRISQIKFAMPNVKAGSIIEYKYESVMKHYGGLDRWIFQSSIPTLRSCYLLQILPNHEFSYVVTKKNNYNIIITPKPDAGQIYFEMANIPGLRFEPYMDAVKDYFQQVEFQLSGYINVHGNKNNVNATWKDVAISLSTDKALGGALKKDLAKADELKLMVEKETSISGKINIIYNYVKNNFIWNSYDSKFATDGLKKIWEKRSGTSGEINLILVNLLQAFDIEAFPLLVAEREFGKIDPRVPFIDRFNKTVAYANADGKIYILDATQKFCPAGLTPYSLLNTYALIVDKKTNSVININSTNEAFFSIATIHATLDKTGLLSGASIIRTEQYAKQLNSEKIKENEKKYIKENIEETNPGLIVDSFAYENLSTDAAPLIQHIKFNEQFNESGGFVLLNYNLFTGLSKNFFTKSERFTNVNFGYPYHITIDETIELPANSKVEGMPANKKLMTSEKNILLAREIGQTGNTLHIKIEFTQIVTLVSHDDYPDLKNFYTQMISILNEPVTIQLGK